MQRTHIRDNSKTEERHPSTWAPGTHQMYWVALCGVERPPSSMSEHHAREWLSAKVDPFPANAVSPCEHCIPLAIARMNQ